MDVDDLAFVGVQEGFPDDAHITRQAHEVDLPGIQDLDDLRFEGGLARIALGREDEGVHAVARRLVDDGGAGLVTHHHGHLGIQDAVGAGASDGVEVGAGPAGEYR